MVSRTPDETTFDSTTRKFDRANALYLAHASRIAYLDDPVLEASEILGLDATAFSDHMTNTQGFVAKNNDYVVLAFRGTEPNQIADWITDFAFLQSSHSPYAGRVHDGFVGALAASWPKVQNALTIASAADLPLFVTGHSLGAALATLAACQLAAQLSFPRWPHTPLDRRAWGTTPSAVPTRFPHTAS
jgi:triacylglycerol lipase